MNMSTKNIFAGFGVKSEFVNLIYSELMKREFVSYADILTLYCKRPNGYYDKIACNSEPGYGELKKAFPEVLNALKAVCPGSIEDNGQNKGKAYRYVGKDDDPLSEERKAVVQKSVEDYVSFCKASAGILPSSWFSAFLVSSGYEIQLVSVIFSLYGLFVAIFSWLTSFFVNIFSVRK